MKRSFVGAFDPNPGLDLAALTGALAPEPAWAFDSPPLWLAYGGPAAATRGGLLCLLDGHLDNAAQIRAELGQPDAPGTAEELLALGYRRWGRGLAERMRGDFALLLWDAERSEGLVVRDQLGLRPLFVCQRGETLLFATEIHRLLALLPSSPEPDSASVAHWILARNRPEMRTLLSGVRRLQPAGMLLLGGHGVRESRYWRPRFEGSLEIPPEQVATRVRDAIELAVGRQMGATGRTGVLMSGGLDSSSIAAIGASQAPGRIYAYAGTFPEHPAVDESELIAELRHALRLPGATAKVRPGGLVDSALRHLASWRMPLLGWSEFWTTPLAGAARSDGVETMLDGTGGDELFGPFSYLLADRLRAGHPREALSLAYRLPGAGSHVPRRQVASVFRTLALSGALPYSLHARGQRLLESREVPGWLLPDSARQLRRSGDPVAWKRLDGPRWWAHTAHGVAREIEASGVVESQNRWASSSGLEVRMPLLDLDLVELALRQPPAATFDRRFSRPLLRVSMEGLLPDSVRLRPAKAWFDSMIVDCLSGADEAAVHAILADPGAELGAFVDLRAMRAELLDDDRGRRHDPLGWMSVVWRLVTMELWLRAQASGAAEVALGAPPSGPQVDVEPVAASSFFPS